LLKNNSDLKFNINVIMSNRQSQVFNQFLRHIKIEFPIDLYPVENIDLTIGIALKEKLDNGDMLFIAGDRVSENNNTKVIKTELFSKTINLPKGTFKLAKLMDTSTYFISAIKIDGKYNIFLEKQTDLKEENLIERYTEFMEKMIKISPLQFFHFYDFFN